MIIANSRAIAVRRKGGRLRIMIVFECGDTDSAVYELIEVFLLPTRQRRLEVGALSGAADLPPYHVERGSWPRQKQGSQSR